MSAVEFKPTIRGFVQLRNSAPVIAELQRRASAIANAAGDGFMTMPPETNYSINGRARVAIIAATKHAQNGEAHDRRLTRAIDAGRG